MEFNGEVIKVQKFINSNAIAFSKIREQKLVAQLFFEEMDLEV
jgi:hypothetical protein